MRMASATFIRIAFCFPFVLLIPSGLWEKKVMTMSSLAREERMILHRGDDSYGIADNQLDTEPDIRPTGPSGYRF